MNIEDPKEFVAAIGTPEDWKTEPTNIDSPAQPEPAKPHEELKLDSSEKIVGSVATKDEINSALNGLEHESSE